VDKSNVKQKNMNQYVASVKATQMKESQQLKRLKKIIREVEPKIELNRINEPPQINIENNKDLVTFHLDNKLNFDLFKNMNVELDEDAANKIIDLNHLLDFNKVNNLVDFHKVNNLVDFHKFDKEFIESVDYSILNKINTVHNVYKYRYIKDKYVSGFGDFLRGCYFLLDFCKTFKLKYNIILLHPISQFLKNKNKEIPNEINENVEFLNYCNNVSDYNATFNTHTKDLYKNFFEYLNKQRVINKQVYVYSTCYPTQDISVENKQIIRIMIEPVDEIYVLVERALNNLNLTKRSFHVLHIRSGDIYLTKRKNKFTNDYCNKLLNEVTKIIKQNTNKPFFLISDNNIVKQFLVQKIPSIKTVIKPISHLGENNPLDNETMKNTMADFYIMSYASSIHAISCYGHGSGFSRWCAVTYDIPYHCVLVENNI
jgi:hypothetical protein